MSQVQCPDCSQRIPRHDIRLHILSCRTYKARLFESTSRLADSLNPEYLRFLIEEIDMAKEVLQRRIDEEAPQQEKPEISIPIQQNHPTHLLEPEQNPPEEVKNSLQEAMHGDMGLSKQQSMACLSCEKIFGTTDMESIVFVQPCCHLFCRNCISKSIKLGYVKQKGILKCPQKDCEVQMSTAQIREIVGVEEFGQMENLLLREIVNLIFCCKCGHEFEFSEGSWKDAPKKNENGETVAKKYAEHYALNRFVCSNSACKQEQCRSCKSTPYHLGKDCAENQNYKLAKKCRYCNSMLPKGYMSSIGIKAFDDVCDAVECRKATKNACSKIHKCRHPCMGYINEKECLPCLRESCAKGKVEHGQDEDSFCSICYIEDLKASPCVKSKCGHIFHYACLQKRLKIRWLTPRILFNFCMCPLCKEWIQLKDDCPLSKELKECARLEEELKKKALLRLKHEKLDKDKRITDSKSEYYNKEVEYALAIYAYFQCFKCKKPYFGGRKNCAEVMEIDNSSNGREGQQFDPAKLICAECCPIPTKDCATHGKQFLTFKCKFCCNISQWFCWGNTHFCDICHKKQLEGVYVSKLPKDKLPVCEGPEKCPSGGGHPPNGEQYNLGCLLCRNYKEHHKEL